MNEQQIREIAKAAFEARFGDVKIVRVNIGPGFDIDDDPMVEVKIIYEGKYEQLNPAGLIRVQSEIISKMRADPAQDPGFPVVRFIAKSDIGRQDPATV